MSVRASIKAVVGASFLSFAAVLLLFKLFYASIFSSLGLAVVSASTLQSLSASRQLVQTMKSRNLDKRSSAHKRFLKKTSKKLIATSAAAATLGTAAVILTTIGLEADEYCSDLQDLEEERAILEARQAQFDYQSCADAAAADLQSITEELREQSGKWLNNTLAPG